MFYLADEKFHPNKTYIIKIQFVMTHHQLL